MSKDSFIFYHSFYEAAEELDPLDRLEFYEAIIEYSNNQPNTEIPKIKPHLRAMLKLVVPIMDVNYQRYLNGGKGGRPKKVSNNRHNQTEPNHNQTEPNHNQTITTPEPAPSNDVSVSVSVNVSEDEDEDVSEDGPGSDSQKPKKTKSEIFRDVCLKIDLPEGIDRGHWKEWINYRWMIKKPYKTIKGLNRAINDLVKAQAENNDSFTDIINQSIEKEWISFFAIKEQSFNPKTVKQVLGEDGRYPGE